MINEAGTDHTVWPTHKIASQINGGYYNSPCLGYQQQKLPDISLLNSFTYLLSLSSAHSSLRHMEQVPYLRVPRARTLSPTEA